MNKKCWSVRPYCGRAGGTAVEWGKGMMIMMMMMMMMTMIRPWSVRPQCFENRVYCCGMIGDDDDDDDDDHDDGIQVR